MNLKERAQRLKVDIPTLFLALKCSETPIAAKLLAAITVVYALSPIDLIPDFIPVLGYLDDLLLLPALIALTVKLIPPELFQKYREDARGMWENGKPKRWYYAVPILIVWILAAWLVCQLLILPDW